MKRILASLLALALAASPAYAADSTVSAMSAASALDGTELYYCVQAGADRKCTGAQVKTLAITSAVNAQTGTTYTVLAGDQGKLVTFSNAGSIAVTQPQASATFFAGWSVSFRNLGAGTVTVTPTTSTVDGAASFTLLTGQGVDMYSDGTNYFTQPGAPRLAALQGLGTNVATALGTAVGSAGGPLVNGGVLGTPSSGTLTNTTGFPTASLAGAGTGVLAALAVNVGSAGSIVVNGGALGTPSSGTLTNTTGFPIASLANAGANVLTALGVALSAAGGVTTTVTSGTSALGTTGISSAACATVVTTTATGAATTDAILAGFNGDPTGVTGYAASANGMLTIIAYPSANNVNFKVCNNTASTVTPGAITLNWRILR